MLILSNYKTKSLLIPDPCILFSIKLIIFRAIIHQVFLSDLDILDFYVSNQLVSVALSSAYVAQITRKKQRQKQQKWVCENQFGIQVRFFSTATYVHICILVETRTQS
jgi:hypothetical protein